MNFKLANPSKKFTEMLTTTGSESRSSTPNTWTFLLLMIAVLVTQTRSNEDLVHDKNNSTTSGESSQETLLSESWVKIPDWRTHTEAETTSASSERFGNPVGYYKKGASWGSSSSGSSRTRHHPQPPPSTYTGDGESYEDGDPSGGSDTSKENQPEPYFDHAMMTNLSEHLGSNAYLRCRVKNLGDRTVSWIRRRDWHILTAGRQVYTTDERFQIVHHEGSDEWTLVIRYLQRRDGGTYECQVSSPRGIIAHFFNLNVLVPQAYILGASEYHVQQGTVLTLVCIIENSPRLTSQYLYWYHNNQMVNLIGSGISVHTENGNHIHSRLTVPSAGPQHAGTYTCNATNTEPASVHVYVSDGDKTAAIQRASGSHFVPPGWTIFLAAFTSSCYHYHACIVGGFALLLKGLLDGRSGGDVGTR